MYKSNLLSKITTGLLMLSLASCGKSTVDYNLTIRRPGVKKDWVYRTGTPAPILIAHPGLRAYKIFINGEQTDLENPNHLKRLTKEGLLVQRVTGYGRTKPEGESDIDLVTFTSFHQGEVPVVTRDINGTLADSVRLAYSGDSLYRVPEGVPEDKVKTAQFVGDAGIDLTKRGARNKANELWGYLKGKYEGWKSSKPQGKDIPTPPKGESRGGRSYLDE